jgi:hypothetical protein
VGGPGCRCTDKCTDRAASILYTLFMANLFECLLASVCCRCISILGKVADPRFSARQADETSRRPLQWSLRNPLRCVATITACCAASLLYSLLMVLWDTL